MRDVPEGAAVLAVTLSVAASGELELRCEAEVAGEADGPPTMTPLAKVCV